MSNHSIFVTEDVDKVIFHNLSDDYFDDSINYLTNDSNNFLLNYYQFNILVELTKNQKNIFNNLDHGFFNELSKHKNKLYFFININFKNKIVTITGIVYKHPFKKTGVHVKKHITANFNKKNVKIYQNSKYSKKLGYSYFGFL